MRRAVIPILSLCIVSPPVLAGTPRTGKASRKTPTKTHADKTPRTAPNAATTGNKDGTAAPGIPAPTPKTDDHRLKALQNQVEALKKKVEQLEEGQGQNEVKQIILESKVEALTPAKESFRIKTFTGHARALQGLNPEISITGDLGGMFLWSNGREYLGDSRSGFWFRGLGFHFQSSLDPFSFMKAAISVSPHGVEFGEAYVVWTDVGNVMNITVGKFRQQLGVINRWHKHALDQFDFPLMLREPFGEGGLNQIGASFEFLIPHFIADANQLILQVTNGMNAKAFAGKYFSLPTTLLHFKNYWDLNRNTYLEFGMTGILGFNNHRGLMTTGALFTDQSRTSPFELYDDNGNPVSLPFAPATGTADESLRITAFGGADLTIQWEPVNQAKYHNVIWRTEFLYGYKDTGKISNSGDKEPINWFGGYTYLQAKVSRQVELGVRGDLVQPFTEDNKGHYVYQVSPYVTWWQSPWVKMRFEYDYVDGDMMEAIHRGIVQVVFAAGPHKHDRH